MLDAELIDKHARPFQWGVSDCVHWAADACDYYGGWRPPMPAYTSKAEADALISERGSLDKLVRDAMGEPVPVKDLRLGDVVIAAFPDSGQVVGVADPPLFWLRSEKGLMPVHLNSALWGWPCRR